MTSNVKVAGSGSLGQAQRNVGIFSPGSFGLPSPSGSGFIPAFVVSKDV
jgi:hypothetical protein